MINKLQTYQRDETTAGKKEEIEGEEEKRGGGRGENWRNENGERRDNFRVDCGCRCRQDSVLSPEATADSTCPPLLQYCLVFLTAGTNCRPFAHRDTGLADSAPWGFDFPAN